MGISIIKTLVLVWSFFRRKDDYIVIKSVLNIAEAIAKVTKNKMDDNALSIIAAIIDYQIKGLDKGAALNVLDAISKSKLSPLKGITVGYSESGEIVVKSPVSEIAYDKSPIAQIMYGQSPTENEKPITLELIVPKKKKLK